MLNGNETQDFALFIDFAKKLSMMARTPSGETIRQYFVDIEKEALSKNKKELDFSDPNTVLMLAQNWADEKNKRIEAERQIEIKEKQIKQLAPKAELMQKVIDTDDKIDIGQAAKILELPFGRNTLFIKLRQMGVFFKHRNEPKQEYIERGYFQLKEKLIKPNNHDSFTVMKVLVTQKGLEFLSKIFHVSTTNNSKLAKIQ